MDKVGDGMSRAAWAILRPDGETLHPESVRGGEHAAQWSIGNWAQMERDGFRCVPVTIVYARAERKALERT